MASKKDYEAIASILRREDQKIIEGIQQQRDPALILTILTNKIAGYFRRDSNKFDWDRFAEASRYNATPKPHISKCCCTECHRDVDEDTFIELEGMCELCDQLQWPDVQRNIDKE